MVLSLHFTGFNIQWEYDYDYTDHPHNVVKFVACKYDHLTITDGDGTTLMEKKCGEVLPADITSRSNIVNLLFITDSSYADSGWSVSWTAVTPGECQQYV